MILNLTISGKKYLINTNEIVEASLLRAQDEHGYLNILYKGYDISTEIFSNYDEISGAYDFIMKMIAVENKVATFPIPTPSTNENNGGETPYTSTMTPMPSLDTCVLIND